MSITFVPNHQRGKIPPNHATIQKMLDENTQFIQTIVDYQNKGKVHEVSHFTQLLHRNLVYLATVADSTQNIIPPPNANQALATQPSGATGVAVASNSILHNGTNQMQPTMAVSGQVGTGAEGPVTGSAVISNPQPNNKSLPIGNAGSPGLQVNGVNSTPNMYQDNGSVPISLASQTQAGVAATSARQSPGLNQTAVTRSEQSSDQGSRQASPADAHMASPQAATTPQPAYPGEAPVVSINTTVSTASQPQDAKAVQYMAPGMSNSPMQQMNPMAQQIRAGQTMGIAHGGQPMHGYSMVPANHQVYSQWHPSGNYGGMGQPMQQQQAMYVGNAQPPTQHVNVSQSAPLAPPRHMMSSTPMAQRSPNNMAGHYGGANQSFNSGATSYPNQGYMAGSGPANNAYHSAAQGAPNSQSVPYSHYQQTEQNFQQNQRSSGPPMAAGAGPNGIGQQGQRPPGHYQNYNPAQF